eukprot:TRINITY_DN20657_c0_g1_i1.p1 TRINITY_DN20657_c0_g1~~TRINITY_DN20657_c0_g1_i1.p1  ORF type:complete len:187 (+),score=27.66 TRINITY_DN20657_c0_g1_i1:89-649(+)
MIRRPPRSTQGVSSAASDVYKRQVSTQSTWAAEPGVDDEAVFHPPSRPHMRTVVTRSGGRGNQLEEFRCDLNLLHYDFQKEPFAAAHQTSSDFYSFPKRARAFQASVPPDRREHQRGDNAMRAFINLKNFVEAQGGVAMRMPKKTLKKLPPLQDHALGRRFGNQRFCGNVYPMHNARVILEDISAS